jgi:AraC family transcriptional regulator, regulatory protein of adaptative response / methylated-DNA-[protein]-cysteine methyltransferase
MSVPAITRHPAELHYAIGRCSLGSVLVARGERGLCAVLLGDDPESVTCELEKRFPQTTLLRRDQDLAQYLSQVVGLIEAPGRPLDLLLDLRGTTFQQRVWQALREIPAGTTSTYSKLASRIGAPKAVRAVARACATNPLALVAPCHRVIGKDGGLTGYRWGVERKRILLERESQR